MWPSPVGKKREMFQNNKTIHFFITLFHYKTELLIAAAMDRWSLAIFHKNECVKLNSQACCLTLLKTMSMLSP